jgi:hypothetical protein
MLAIGLMVACSNSVEPADAIAGLYVLDQVDGNPIPPSPPPVTDDTVPCPVAVTDGQLSLEAAAPRIPQGYVFSVYSSPTCEPMGIPSDATEVAHDAGFWSLLGKELQFESSPSNGHGSYGGAVLPGNGPSGAPRVQVAFGGHTYAFLPLDQIRPVPGITVNVVDQSGARVDGALVVIRLSDREVDRSFTSSALPLSPRIGVPGPAWVSIAPPKGYGFALGQQNPVTVTIVSGEITQVVVVVVKTGS